MAGMIPFRLGGDYLLRYDALVFRLGLNRAQLVRNLLSLDPDLIDTIEDKAKTLSQITLDESITRSNKKSEDLPPVITIRLDKEFEQRFNVLATSLGVNKVQVLRNLLSGDPVLVSGVCKKARIIDPSFIKASKAVEVKQQSYIPLQVEACPKESPDASQQSPEPQTGFSTFLEFQEESEQAPSKPKRDRKKCNATKESVDHSEERRQIIEYLNLRANKNFYYDSKEAINAIDKMLDRGKPVEHFIKIIDNMTPVWIDSLEMNVRLCPETLFRRINWEKYLNSKGAELSEKGPKAPKGSGKPSAKEDKYEKFYL